MPSYSSGYYLLKIKDIEDTISNMGGDIALQEIRSGNSYVIFNKGALTQLLKLLKYYEELYEQALILEGSGRSFKRKYNLDFDIS